MGFLDDLDSAFDNLLSGEGPPPNAQPQPEIPEEDSLSEAIADQQSAVIHALISLLDTSPRRFLLTALSASLHYFLEIETNASPRALAAREMAGDLKTRKGSVRQRLTSTQKGSLIAQQAIMTPAAPAEVIQAKRLLVGLMGMEQVNLDSVHSLYAAGIWRGDQVFQEVLDQLVHVSGWEKSNLAQLAQTLASL